MTFFDEEGSRIEGGTFFSPGEEAHCFIGGRAQTLLHGLINGIHAEEGDESSRIAVLIDLDISSAKVSTHVKNGGTA